MKDKGRVKNLYNLDGIDDLKVLHAVKKACMDLKGNFAIQVISSFMPDNMIVIRKDSPLVIGKGDGENYISSDIPAILFKLMVGVKVLKFVNVRMIRLILF